MVNNMRLIDADKITFNITHDFDDEGNATPSSDEELTQKCLSIADVVGWLKIAPTVDAESVVRCRDCKHRFLEIIEGKKVFSCLYRMGTLDLNGYCDCGARMDEVME